MEQTESHNNGFLENFQHMDHDYAKINNNLNPSSNGTAKSGNTVTKKTSLVGGAKTASNTKSNAATATGQTKPPQMK